MIRGMIRSWISEGLVQKTVSLNLSWVHILSDEKVRLLTDFIFLNKNVINASFLPPFVFSIFECRKIWMLLTWIYGTILAHSQCIEVNKFLLHYLSNWLILRIFIKVTCEEDDIILEKILFHIFNYVP